MSQRTCWRGRLSKSATTFGSERTRSFCPACLGPYEIVACNLARVIRMRFDERQIAALESSRWWELDRHELADRIGELDAMLQNPENPE